MYMKGPLTAALKWAGGDHSFLRSWLSNVFSPDVSYTYGAKFPAYSPDSLESVVSCISGNEQVSSFCRSRSAEDLPKRLLRTTEQPLLVHIN